MAQTLSIIIGNRIRNRRESLGLVREKLAEQCELSVQFLADIEKGRKNMTTLSLYKVAKALNMSADYILFGEDISSKQSEIEKLFSQLSKKNRELAEGILRSFVKAVTDRD